MILVFGALLGFAAVAFGTYSEHVLKDQVTVEHFRNLMTALRYNQVNSVVITAIGLALSNGGKLSEITAFKWSGTLFILGTTLFSFSIYLSISLEIPKLVYLAPIGGMTIMLSWITLLFAALTALKKK